MDQQASDVDQQVKSRFSLPPALRYLAYRKYWLGSLASVAGFQMFQFSQLWLIHHDLGKSPLFLGYVGLANAIPAIVLNLFGGVFADKLDNRRLIMTTQTILAALIFLLGTLAVLELVQVWHVLTIAFFAGAVNAFDQPARQALYPHLIERKVMMSAVALNSSLWQGTRIVAPAITGVIIATLGTSASIYIAGAGFFVMAVVMAGLKVPRIERGATGGTFHDMLEGMKFIKTNSIFSFLIGMTFFNSFFGMAYIAMMPVFAEDILGQGPGAMGIILSAGGVGSLLTTAWMGTRGTSRHKGLVLIGGAVMNGLAIATFAFTAEYVGSYPLAIALMFSIGVFTTLYMISIMSSLQIMVPDRMRGRVMGFYGMTYSILPLGGMQAGFMATFVGVPVAIAIGGFAVSAFAIGPALINRKVRNLGALLLQAECESAAEPKAQSYKPSASPSTGDD